MKTQILAHPVSINFFVTQTTNATCSVAVIQSNNRDHVTWQYSETVISDDDGDTAVPLGDTACVTAHTETDRRTDRQTDTETGLRVVSLRAIIFITPLPRRPRDRIKAPK